ncbi:Tricarboxylate/iron carrier [Fimicolochytrium jonesii]|uniref:Tricarboxylate/iron carrier n=1 Tax=Fimicolochytrium jonesii TaxID=1396493 RepID=UPI0022FEDC80|nr:Tricarboxylate/iron carrier [Fimicolochytrium jonesii]KAI8826213.1 Tricarboxylate/iron carrier [Fimicolochytrium jonesii]
MAQQQLPTGRIDLDQPRYDQSTYSGRLRHFSEVTNPLNLLATSAQQDAAKQLVADYKAGKVDADPEALWKAKTLVDSTFHPDTGEKIILPFRMASFVPTNVAIVAGMLMPNPSIRSIVFWQWVNQSVNVAFNYFNANKTTVMDVQETAVAYGTAVAASCTIAVSLSEYVKRATFSPTTQALLARSVPFVAVAAAGSLNVLLMRQKELTEGIDVTDEQGNSVGKSTEAGKKAIAQVAISRVATSFPVVFIPSLLMARIDRTQFLKRHPGYRTPINLATITGSLLAALPCAVALFPQRATMRVSDLEERMRGVRGRDGRVLETVWFNRGL